MYDTSLWLQRGSLQGRRYAGWGCSWAPSARTDSEDESPLKWWRCSRPGCGITSYMGWRCSESRRRPHGGPNAWVGAAGWLFIAGIVIFSGSLYVLSVTGIRWLGAITPIGGLCFTVGWLVLAVGAMRAS